MSFIHIANERYSTKKYNSNKKVTPEQITELKEILRLSPSSINSQPWKFHVVENEQIKNELAEASMFNAPKVRDASHLIVFSAVQDLNLFEKQIEENLPEGAVNYYKQFVKIQDPISVQSWLAHQVYLSLGFFLSACASMNIDSTPMEGIDSEAYARILKIEGYKPLFAVAIGYRDAEDSNQPLIKPKSRLKMEEVVHHI